MGLLLEPGATLSIEEASDLKSLEADWRRLWKQLPEPSALQNYSLIESAAAEIPAGQIKLLAAHSDRIVGIIPLYGNGTLRLIGNDSLILPGFEQLVMDAAREHLLCERERWQACDWENLPPHSPLLLSDFGPGYSDLVEAVDACPLASLAGNDRSGAFKLFDSAPGAEPPAPKRLCAYRRLIRRL